ncbi:unnamed protein product, partial [Effrenium voratum]
MMIDPLTALLGIAFLHFHFRVNGFHNPTLDWLRHVMPFRSEQSVKERQASELLWDVRAQIFVMVVTSFGMQLVVGSILVFGYLWLKEMTYETASRLAPVIAVYPFMCAAAKMDHSPSRLKAYFALQHGCMVLISSALPGLSDTDALAIEGFLIACRFTLALMFVNIKLTIPAQILLSAVEIQRRWGVMSSAVLLREFGVLVCIIYIAAILEFHLQAHIKVLCESAESESMLSCFRRLIRGVCDGDVLLDSQLKIHGEPNCLKHLLMTKTPLHGKPFENLLDEDAKTRFAELVASTKTEEMKESSVPPCLRASLRGSNDIKVGVDLFHVSVPKYFGARDAYHLIAFREDTESRIPEAAANLGELPQWNDHLKGVRMARAASKRTLAESSVCSSSRSETFAELPELKEITLLVDASSISLDVVQAHFRFGRVSGLGRQAEMGAQMPCLHSLLRPTDRATVMGYVKQFAESK